MKAKLGLARPKRKVPENMRLVEKMDAKGFNKVIEINDWGAYASFLWLYESMWGTRGIQGQDREALLKPGDVVEVRWDDGSITTETLKGEQETYYVSEQGSPNPYPVTSQRLYVGAKAHGVPVRVPIDGLWVRRKR